MNSTKGTGDRSASLDPVYRRVEVMREFSDAVHAAFTTLKATLAHIGIADIKSPRPTFHLVRRVWPQDRDAAASFAYSFYAPEALDPDSDVAGKLIERIFQDLDQKLHPPFSTYLDWMREKRNVQAVRQAIKWFEAERTRAQFHEWFEAERTRAQSQGGGGEETLRRNLVHYLLLLFSRTPIDGGIATTLLKEEYRPKGPKDLATLPIMYVETYRGTSSEGGALPPLRVVPLSGSDENGKPFKTEQDSVSDLPDFFLDIMDPWFREGTLPDPKPGERRVSLSASREGLHMLWLPVFDFVRGDRNAGFFLGWAFQQLWQDASGSNDLTETPEVLRAMREYAVACRQPFALLSSRLSEQGLREVLAQDPSRDTDAVKGAVDSLKRHLYLVQAWDPVDEPGACTPEAGDWCVDGDGRLKVSLGPGRFDDQELFWRESLKHRPPTIVLRPREGEFSRPHDDDATECYGQIARWVRVIFSFFQQTLLRLEHARVAEAHRVKGDLVATFSHSFGKVADSAAQALQVSSPAEIVQRVQRILNGALEDLPKNSREQIRRIVQELEPLSTIATNPGVHLFTAYLKPQIEQLYNSVALVERVRDPKKLRQGEPVLLRRLVDDVVRNLLLDVAWRAPFALLYLLGWGSRKNANKRADYPKELTRIERTAMLHGPLAYVRSRRRLRRVRSASRPAAQATPTMAVDATHQGG